MAIFDVYHERKKWLDTVEKYELRLITVSWTTQTKTWRTCVFIR